MKLSDFYNDVSRTVDTGKTEIPVADTKRVLSEAFLCLAKMSPAESADVVAKGLKQSQKKIDKGS